MASALSPPRVPKHKGALPSHYYESFLEKKGPRDQDYKKFWAGLQGCTLYFYNSNRDSQHVEKLGLTAFVRLTDEAPWGSSRDPGFYFSLVLRNQEIKFKVESLESREMWKGFILTVVEVRGLACSEPSFLFPPDIPQTSLLHTVACEPGACPPTHHCLCRTSVVRHYKVKHEGPKYVIDVEEPFSCASLDAVVDYFVSHTNKALVPFLLDEDYEKVLGHVEADKENGESVWVARSTPGAPGPGPAPASGGPKQLPPVPITPVASQERSAPLLNQEENYVIPIGDAPAANYVNEDVPSRSRPVLNPRKLAKVQAKPLKPPVAPKPEPKGLHGGLAKKLAVGSMQTLFPSTGLADLTAELAEKLQRRRALEHSAGHAGDQ
uniref:Signal transducing adaptor family member 2 n=1 Tax=Ursus maritimus TaxID=29073 RepID=A0A452TPV7_URSMA